MPVPAFRSFHFHQLTRNTVQAVDRALLVDILSTSLQPSGNAWAAKMLGFGSVLGFFMYVARVHFLKLIKCVYIEAISISPPFFRFLVP